MKTNKNIKNIVYTVLGQIIVLGLALIVPRFILSGYGSDANGLLSTIGQIVAYMALLEAGIGQAARNELYHFVRGNDLDRQKISSVMSVSRKAYRDVTKIYAFFVILLALVLPFVIKTDIDHVTVSLIILIEGTAGVISFFFVQNHTNLLIVDGKQYVNSNVDMLFKSLNYVIKIAMVLLGVNIVLMEIGYLAAVVIKILIYERYMRTHYDWVDYKSVDDQVKLKDRGPYVITEVAWTVFSSTDMIVISVFCSTKSSSVYAIYYLVFMTINRLADALFTSLKFNLGQAYHKSTESYGSTHDMFNSVFFGLISALLIVAYYLCIPFVSLYTAGISDADYIDNALPMCFCLMLLLSWSRMVSEHLIGVAGFAKRLSTVSIVEVVANIALSVILVNGFGVRGVLYATVIALPLKAVYCNVLADKVIMKRSLFPTAKIFFANLLLFVLLAVCRNYLTIEISSYAELLIYGAVFTVCSVAVFLLVNLLMNRNMFSAVKRFLPGKKT